MKHSKLLMSVFAALIIASMILTGCGGAATQPPQTEAPPEATEAPQLKLKPHLLQSCLSA